MMYMRKFNTFCSDLEINTYIYIKSGTVTVNFKQIKLLNSHSSLKQGLLYLDLNCYMVIF